MYKGFYFNVSCSSTVFTFVIAIPGIIPGTEKAPMFDQVNSVYLFIFFCA